MKIKTKKGKMQEGIENHPQQQSCIVKNIIFLTKNALP
jgi:hypothetical protein